MNSQYVTDPAWLIAIATLLGVVVAIVALILQTQSFKLTIGADLGMKLDDRFNSDEFLPKRLAAANALKDNLDLENAEDVFDFFDTVGLFVRLKALRAEIAHSLFFHWINLYWCAGKGYIEERQKESRLTWANFASLYEKTRRIEEKRDPGSRDLRLNHADIEEYLTEEIDSVSKPIRRHA